MPGMTGMDIAQIRALARQMRDEGSAVETAVRTLTTRITALHWSGADRERFVREWQSHHAAASLRVVEGLRAASAQAAQYADRQDAASRA